MASFRVVVSDQQTGKAYQLDLSGDKANRVLGKSIGDEIPGHLVGLSGYGLKITGGADKDGFPMRNDLSGPVRRKLLLSGGLGYHPKHDGRRRRKTMRGPEVSPDIVQINAVVSKYGAKEIEKLVDKTKRGG